MDASTIAKQVAGLKAQMAWQPHNEVLDVVEREPSTLAGLSELGGVLLVGSLAKVKIYTPYERRPA